jgi:hypothetical protein
MRVQTRRAFGESRIHACRCGHQVPWGAEKESRGAPDWFQVMINTSASDTLSHATRRSGRALPSLKTRAGPERWLTSLIRTTFDLATAGQGGTVRSLTGVRQTKCISRSDWRHLTTHNHNNCAFVGAIRARPCAQRDANACHVHWPAARSVDSCVPSLSHSSDAPATTLSQTTPNNKHPHSTPRRQRQSRHSTDGRTVVTQGLEYHPSAITSCFWIECTCRQREKEREEGAAGVMATHTAQVTSTFEPDDVVVRSLITFLMPLTGTCHSLVT